MMQNVHFLKMLIQNLQHTKPNFISRQPQIRTTNDVIQEFYTYTERLPEVKSDPSITLEPRCPTQSELHVVIPLASDLKTRLLMTDSNNKIRPGRLVETIDIIAPCSAYMHNRKDISQEDFDIGSQPRIFVTAKFTQSNLLNARHLSPMQDILLKTKVIWSNGARAEVKATVHQNNQEFFNTSILFASLDGHNPTKKSPVHPLYFENPIEIAIQQEKHKAKPMTSVYPAIVPQEGDVSVESTKVETTMVAQPEHQNPYGTVFGGFLIRRGIETAELCAKMFVDSPCHLASIDNAEFLKVARIGGVLRFSATVVNVDQKKHRFQVSSNVETFNEKNKTFEVCDRFLVTFQTEQSCTLPQVFEETQCEVDSSMNIRNLVN